MKFWSKKIWNKSGARAPVKQEGALVFFVAAMAARTTLASARAATTKKPNAIKTS